MTEPPTAGGEQNLSDLESVADYVERWFNEEWFDGVQRSLSNEETAAVFLRTVDLFQHILKGAVASGIIDEEQRAKLADLLDAARQAPGLIQEPDQL